MFAKILRVVGIVMMSLTGAFTVLAGAGTTCVAIGAENYESMTGLVPYKWLYVVFVVVTFGIGVMGVRATIKLIRRQPKALSATMTALVLGLVVGGIHMGVSRSLRGSSMPVDAVVWTTLLTLVVFLVLRSPRYAESFNPAEEHESTGQLSGGLAAIVVGVLCLTIQYWMADTHTIAGINFADIWHVEFMLIGWGLTLLGMGLLVRNTLIAEPGKRAPSSPARSF